MLERRRSPDSVGLELAALRIEHNFYANVRTVLVDALYLSPAERDLLSQLEALITEVAAWGAAHGVPTDELRLPPDQEPGLRRPPDSRRGAQGNAGSHRPHTPERPGSTPGRAMDH